MNSFEKMFMNNQFPEAGSENKPERGEFTPEKAFQEEYDTVKKMNLGDRAKKAAKIMLFITALSAGAGMISEAKAEQPQNNKQTEQTYDGEKDQNKEVGTYTDEDAQKMDGIFSENTQGAGQEKEAKYKVPPVKIKFVPFEIRKGYPQPDIFRSPKRTHNRTTFRKKNPAVVIHQDSRGTHGYIDIIRVIKGL